MALSSAQELVAREISLQAFNVLERLGKKKKDGKRVLHGPLAIVQKATALD